MDSLFMLLLFFLRTRRPPRSPLFPYTTLFRSVDAPERQRGGWMVEEGGRRRDSGGKVTPLRRQADGADHERDGEGARRGLVLEGEDSGSGDQRSERTDCRHQQRRSEGESERFRHQQQAPYAERAGGDLLGGEHFLEACAAHRTEPESRLVVERKGHVGMLHQDVVAQHRGVAQVLQDRDVDLAILLQPGVAGELKKSEQRERYGGSSGRQRFHFAGVFSNCCLAQRRLGLSSRDLANAWRASASRFSLRRLRPSHSQASALARSSSMAFWKSGMASLAPPPSWAGT